MKRKIAVLLAAFGFAACGQSTQTAETTPAAAAQATELTLACADFATLTPDALTQRFGAGNISTQTMSGPEGESYEATLVFANDPTRQLEVIWNDARTAPASVSVKTAGTQWRGAEGYAIGAPISQIESINVMPFKLWGFGWDYGGWVSDWGLGTFSQNPGCRTRIRFDARVEPGVAASGDSEFSSNDPAIRAADPAVSEFGLVFGAS